MEDQAQQCQDSPEPQAYRKLPDMPENFSPPSHNIYKRINEVRKKIEYLRRDLLVSEGGKYSAISHDYVTEKIRAHLIEHGVVIVPNVLSRKMEATGAKTSRGTPWYRYEGCYCVEFVNIDAPKDKFTMLVDAHAMDTGDKAPGKAVSYATKAAILKVFNIATGDDDEERSSDVQAALPAKQMADFENQIDSLTDLTAAEELWRKIVSACKEVDDMSAATRLKGRISARGTALRKKAEAANV